MSKWYCLIDGKQIGPIDSAKVKQLAEAGTLKPQHKVRREDMAEWHEAREVKGLFAAGQPTSSVASSAAPAQPQPASPRKAANQVHPGSAPAVKTSAAVGAAKNSPPSQSSVDETTATAREFRTTDKLSTKKGKAMGCGCLLVLFALLLPAIHAARESAKRNAARSVEPKGRGVNGIEGSLSSFSEIPPPVELAIGEGKQVWALNGHPGSAPAQRKVVYLIIDQEKLTKLISKNEFSEAEARAFGVSKYYWGEDTLNADSGNIKRQWIFEQRGMEATLTYKTHVQDPPSIAADGVAITRITLDPQGKSGRWSCSKTLKRHYSDTLAHLPDDEAPAERNSGTVDVL